MRTRTYPSDISDEQWSLIEPHIPVYPGGRPRTTNLRDVVDAIFYLLRTGCQWRYLPKDFPPKSTTWRYFDEWRYNGTLDTIHDRLRTKVRTQEKPYAPRTTASVDSQSVDTTSGGEHRGRDNAKNVDGRKRHIVVDSLGLLLAVLVTAASVDDAQAAQELFPRLDGQPVSQVRRVFADNKYHNYALIRVGRDQRCVGVGDRAAAGGPEGVGEVAAAVDSRADVRVARPVPATDQGSGEDREVVGGVHQIGHDPTHAQSVEAQTDGCRVPLPISCLNRPYGTVTKHGESLSAMESVVLSDIIRQEAYVHKITNGSPGAIYKIERKTSWKNGIHLDQQLHGQAQIGAKFPVDIVLIEAGIKAEISRRSIEYSHNSGSTEIVYEGKVPESGQVHIVWIEKVRTGTVKCRIDGVNREFQFDVLCGTEVNHMGSLPRK